MVISMCSLLCCWKSVCYDQCVLLAKQPLPCFILYSKAKLVCVQLFVACQAPLSMVFPRQEYWSGLPFPFQGIFLTQGSNLQFLLGRHRLHWWAGYLPLSHRAPPSMGFSRQEYWSGLSCPPPGDLLNPGVKPRSPTLQAYSLPAEF